jgi:hypothetical protein
VGDPETEEGANEIYDGDTMDTGIEMFFEINHKASKTMEITPNTNIL